MKRYILTLMGLCFCATLQGQNLRGHYDTTNVITITSGYNAIGRDAKSNVFLHGVYAYNHEITHGKVILQLPLSGYVTSYSDSVSYPYTLLQPGSISFLPTLYLVNKGKNLQYELFAFLSAGVKIFPTNNLFRTEQSPDVIEQGVMGVGGGLRISNLLEVSVEYNYAWNNLTTRTEGYFRNNAILNQNMNLKSLRGSLKVYLVHSKHFDLNSSLDWLGYLNTFNDQRFVRAAVGANLKF